MGTCEYIWTEMVPNPELTLYWQISFRVSTESTRKFRHYFDRYVTYFAISTYFTRKIIDSHYEFCDIN